MCVTPESFTATGLDKFYDINAISKDDDGVAFVASMEAKNYPFWGIQFHPEKMIFDWKYPNIIHSAQNVAVSQYFANFFVNQGWLFCSPIITYGIIDYILFYSKTKSAQFLYLH